MNDNHQNLVYVVDRYERSQSVIRKIQDQMNALNREGVRTDFVKNSIQDYFQHTEGKRLLRILNICIYYCFHEIYWYKRLSGIINDMDINSCLYMRMPVPTLFCWWFFNIKRRCKIVIESNSIEPIENIGKKFYFYPVLDLIFGRAIRSRADGLVGVTQEIVEYEKNRSGNKKKSAICIGNGIDTKSVPIRIPPNNLEDIIHVLFAANINRWHGIDRFIQGMNQNGTGIILHIAGAGPELESLIELSKKLNLSDQVTFYGPLSGDDYNNLYNICHIAVGSLGIHRKRLKETSELKIRDYCTRGIPFVLGCEDSEIPSIFPYVLRVSADETPIDMDAVREFTKKVLYDQEHPVYMREYAKQNLDWGGKMKKLKKFLEDIHK